MNHFAAGASISTLLVVLACINVTAENCPDDFCKELDDGDYKNPDGGDQHFFISCSNGETLCMPCGANLIFDDALKRCEAEAVTEGGDASTGTPVTSQLSIQCPANSCQGNEDGDFENPDGYNKHFFYSCNGNELICRECPAGLVFTNATKRCDYPDTHPQKCPLDACQNQEDGYYANTVPYSPVHFIKCSNGSTTCQSCPEDHVFNATSKECEKSCGSRWSGHKGKGPISSVTTTTTTTTTTSVTTTNFMNPGACHLHHSHLHYKGDKENCSSSGPSTPRDSTPPATDPTELEGAV